MKKTAKIPAALENFGSLPDEAFVRINVVAGLLGCSVPTAWRRAKSGAIPRPAKLGPGVTGFQVGPLREALAKLGGVQ